MKAGKDFVTTIVACGLALAIVAALAVSDMALFKEPDFSRLYQSTLEGAYARFRESDKRVPAGGGEARAEVDPLSPPAAVVKPGASVPGTRQQPAGSAPAAPDLSSQMPGAAELALGNKYAETKEYDKALAAFGQSLQKNPSSSVAYHRIADVLVTQGKPNEAIAAYRKALELQASYHCVHGHIGDILLQQGKAEEAEKAFADLVAAYEGDAKKAGPEGSLAKYHLAKFYIDHDRNLEQAIPLAEEVVKQEPNEVSYLLPLVTAYQKVGRNADAIATIDKIVKLKPEFAPYYEGVRAQLVQPQK